MADKMSLTRLLKLFGISAKMDLAWLLRDTKYALLIIFSEVLSNLSLVSGMFLIAVRFGGIGGMTADEVLFMMAYSTIVTGLTIMFGAGNNILVSRIIGRGQLDHLFLQPLSLKTQLLTCGFMPFTGGSNFVVGVVLMAVSMQRMGLAVTPGWVLSLAAYLLTTLVIFIALCYLISSVAFYAPVAAEELSWQLTDGMSLVGTFPLSGMPAFIQVPLLTVLPQGLMAWFPSLCLLGKPLEGWSAYYPMLYALLLALLASVFFKKGLNHYVKKGSHRYVPYGYRN